MSSKNVIENVLANRYASSTIKDIWSDQAKIVLERDLWIAVLKAQKFLGLDISDEAISSYEYHKNNVDLDKIKIKEKKLRHDVKARIEAFCELAGFEQIHKGMTSRDLTDNVEILQIKKSLELIQKKYFSILWRIKNLVENNSNIMLVARTHNVPAQATTLGKRLAMFGQEMLLAFSKLNHTIDNLCIRGIKGAVGTQVDQFSLFNNQPETILELDQLIGKFLGFNKSLNNVGQVYPRSIDFEVISCLYSLSSGMSSLAKTLRLMAGQELFTEGFKDGQVGSSAMPHKMNTRNLERINGFHIILNGYLNMISGLAGDQWNEGDVSCSVVRRVALPDGFFAIDGQIETMLTVLDEMGFYESMIKKEFEFYLPFISSTRILMEAVKKGAGREAAHLAIKENSIKVLKEIRFGDNNKNDLIDLLAKDSRIPLNKSEIQDSLSDCSSLIGLAREQCLKFINEINEMSEKYLESLNYKPEEII